MSRAFKTVIAHAIEIVEIRLSQWSGDLELCEIHESDDSERESMCDITRELIDDLTAIKSEPEPLQLDQEELNTVLAALRTYQEAGYGDPFNRPDRIQAIAAPTINDTSLDDSAIDNLCERLNT